MLLYVCEDLLAHTSVNDDYEGEVLVINLNVFGCGSVL